MRSVWLILIAMSLALPAMQPVMAAPPEQTFFSFTLDKREAAKDEPVVARYQLTRPAKRVFITATDVEGGPLSFTFPQSSTVNAQRTAGVITFTVPVSAGTLSPLRMALNVDGQLRGLNLLLITCDIPWFFEPRPDRCLYEPATETPAAIQRFEKGAMIWLQADQTIWVFHNDTERVERFNDLFIEGSPESDPAIVAPSGKMQPVRGFGLVWRTSPQVRSQLGWAIAPEQGYTTCAGQAFGGSRSVRTYITTSEQKVVEIETNYAPTRWRLLGDDDPSFKITGCK